MEPRPLIERIARHLAGTDPNRWPDHVEQAGSILALAKEPDAAMREAGDTATWGAMIDAALRQRWDGTHTPVHTSDQPPAGADEEGEAPLSPDAVGRDRADWVHLHPAHDRQT
ncbi:hypothetical protein [Sphingobium sp.]|uniref:hypothetical protein n=1 Tax=Sphingobium sp. TaxID=1912891 RepID=UPI003BB7AA18